MEAHLSTILNNTESNMLMPFLWTHGEPAATVREVIGRINDAGMKAICVESRTHPDFLGAAWWADMQFILDTCQELGMRVWLLDDAHFPTGEAAGQVPQEHRKWMLHEDHVDVVGPCPDAALVPLKSLHGSIDRILAAKRTGIGEQVEPPIDITHCLKDGLVYWDVPDGVWRVFYLTIDQSTHQANGYSRHLDTYLDPTSKDGTQVLISTVYEPHYRHFEKYFGNVFAGFFSDEPQIGTCAKYDAIYGTTPFLPAIWGENIKKKMKERLGAEYETLLPGLWYDIGRETSAVRVVYMDAVSQLYKENFSDVLGHWCREHHVEYIGHVIEENNCHARLGHGAGHYFRALWGQDMAGIDLVLHQVVPGLRSSCHTWQPKGREADDEFFYFGLCQMAASLAKIDPKKKGRVMIENFGAYGWGSGLRQMKWLADFALVRGCNRFVPHAFTLHAFPDEDCPPHFYAMGHNPQYRYTHILSEYINRVANLIDGGSQQNDICVLYHAEAEWCGETMFSQVPVRILSERQIDSNIIPFDMLCDAKTEIKDGVLWIHHASYKALIVPRMRVIPHAIAQWLHEAMRLGLPVLFVDALPAYLETGESYPYADLHAGHVVQQDQLVDTVAGITHLPLLIPTEIKHLRYYHYLRAGLHCFLLMNESISDSIQTEITLPVSDRIFRYDAFENSLCEVEGVNGRTRIAIGPYEMTILLTGDVGTVIAEDAKPSASVCESELRTDWKISTATAEAYPLFTELPDVTELVNISSSGVLPHFSGTIRYEAEFTTDENERILALDLGRVGEIAEVWINDENLGVRIAPPYRFQLNGVARPGSNRLRIEVTNTLGYQQRDFLCAYQPLTPSGLIGPVRLVSEQKHEGW